MPKVMELTINGQRTSVNVEPDVPLLSVLRDYLDLTGTKYGCGEGRCGACSVIIDGQLTRSCVTPVAKAADKNISTIEGLAKDGKLTPLQEAFIKADAMQCAFCTSGMVLAGTALLSRNAHPTREEIVSFMNRNICRCGVYQRIVEAIQSVANPGSAEE
jgi:isoquinoline 1-oxidoreductase alpha subunit